MTYTVILLSMILLFLYEFRHGRLHAFWKAVAGQVGYVPYNG